MFDLGTALILKALDSYYPKLGLRVFPTPKVKRYVVLAKRLSCRQVNRCRGQMGNECLQRRR
jgi:hypothetical protein